MAFADILAAFGHTNPSRQLKPPVPCPTCGQPANGAYETWLQPCGHPVDVVWLIHALGSREAR